MKAISLTQPWATLVATGAKRWETRSWPTQFRGQVAIHASKSYPRDCRELELEPHFFRPALEKRYGPLPLGSVIALGTISDCHSTALFREKGFTHRDRDDVSKLIEISGEEFRFGDFSRGRYAFRIDNVMELRRPIPCRGALGFWPVPDDVVAQIFMQLREMKQEVAI